ncbi:MAG: DEAD/DEAH box helicase [Betaproteobacteria bacterium]
MLVSTKHKKLVLNLQVPEKVLSVIPTAREFEFKGKRLVAVPHRIEETRVLRNLRIAAPSPILHYYDWPGRHTPFVHQRETAEFMTLNPRSFILNDMGTGKTLSALWAFDYLRRFEDVDGAMLVISPLSTLERTWGDEVWRNFPHLEYAVLHGPKKLAMLENGADVFIINHDGIKSKEMSTRIARMVRDKRIRAVVVDELAAYRNSSSERYKSLRTITREAEWLWGMTGTPIPNAPTDAFAQIKLINPNNVTYFNAFREATMRQISKFKWVQRDSALDYVFSVMQPAIRFNRKDCIDLPPTTYTTREVELTADQKRMYKEMVNKFKAEHEAGQITALNEAVKIGKLLQIVCGVAYGDAGDVVVPAQHRLDALLELVEEAGAKVIVFVPFRGALEHVAAHLRSHGYSTEVVHGGVSKADRDRIFGDFMRSRDPRVIAAQPGTMSHGLTLTAANTIVWFAPITSNDIYEQANARIVRPGQKFNTLVAHLEGSDVERRLYRRLQDRGSIQGALLGMFED